MFIWGSGACEQVEDKLAVHPYVEAASVSLRVLGNPPEAEEDCMQLRVVDGVLARVLSFNSKGMSSMADDCSRAGVFGGSARAVR